MGVEHSGKFGAVNGERAVKNWTIGETSTPQPFVGSNTKCGTGRVAGIKDWSGTFSQFSEVVIPIVMPGDDFFFQGFTAPDTDVAGTDGETYEGTAIVDSVSITWDWAGGGIIMLDTAFSAKGALSQTNTTIEDLTTPDPFTTIGTKITFGDEMAMTSTEWERLMNATLTFTSANQAFVNSSTNGNTDRKAGIIDWTLSVTQEQVERGAEPWNIGSDIEFNLFVNSTSFWRLKFGHIKEYVNINVDPETGAILNQTVNIEKSGFVGGVTGQVDFPDASTWWPFT